MNYKYVDTRTTHVYYFPHEKLLFYKVKPDCEVTMEDIVKIYQLTMDLVGKMGVYSITDIREMAFEHIDKDVSDYAANKNPFLKYQLKNAIIVEGLGQKIFGNFYLNVIRSGRPTKLFTTCSSALNWVGVKNVFLDKLS